MESAMKKNVIRISAVVAMAALALSCAKEVDQKEAAPAGEQPVEVVDGVLFKAVAGSVATKTTIENGSGSERIVKWAVDDEINIWWSATGSVSAKAASAGQSTTFSAEVEDAPSYYAVYPKDAASALAMDTDAARGVDTLKIVVPKVQDGAFAGANIAVAKTSAADKQFAFLNMGSLIRFEVASAQYTKAVIRGAKGEVLAGEVPVTFAGSDIALGTVKDAAKSVEVSLSGAGEYYVAILPTTLSGFSITLYKDEVVSPAAYRTTEYVLPRAMLLNAGQIDDKIITDYYASVSGAGTKDGKSAANAFGLTELRDFIRQPLDGEGKQIDGEADFKASILDGATIHFADGEYVIPENAEGFKLEFTSYPKQVHLTFEGTQSAVLSGDNKYRVLTLGNQIELTLNGMSVKNGNREAEASEGAGILLGAGSSGDATLNLSGTLLDNNRNATTTSGGAIRVSKGTLNAVNCEFGKNNYARNGGSIYTNNEVAVVNCTGCTFKSHTFNTGGAANNSKGTQNYVNCTFDGCYTEGGTGGAIHANAAGICVININNCTFKDCQAFKTELDKPNNNKASGIISLQAAQVNIDGTTFENCYSSAGAVILVQNSDAAVLKCQNSVFKNNKGRSRGLIQLNGKSIAFINDCVFYANQMVTSDWGMVLHGGNPSAACLNNCTIYGNVRKNDAGNVVTGGNSVCLNNDGSIILTNSTLIESNDFVSIRSTNASNDAVLVANSIVVNTSSTSNLFVGAKDSKGNPQMKAPFSAFNSILGPSFDPEGITALVANTNNVTDATLATLTGGAYDTTNHVYSWNGPEAGFTKMTPAAFETALKGITVKNGNTVIKDELGTAFYSWLSEIGAIGKDALGTSRGAAWWPGAYQAN